MEDYKKIVIMRTDRIGEVLLATVAVDSIKKQYPGSEITFVTSDYSRDIIDGRENVRELITVDTFSKKGWLIKALRLACILRKKRFDIAIILNPHKILHFAAFLSGIPLRIGYKRKWGFLLNKTILDTRSSGEKHETEYTMELLKEIGVVPVFSEPRLPVFDSAERFIADIFLQNKINSKDLLVVVHPGSSNPIKMWGKDRYAELIKKIKLEINCTVVIIGSGKEFYLSEDIVKTAEVKAFNFSGMFDLKQLTAFLKNADVFIGNDTGSMHMAAALSVPVVAIFGRNIPGAGPVRWRPYGDKHAVIHKKTGCRDCSDQKCDYDRRCLRLVTVFDVYNAVKGIINPDKGCV
ncbi:MAG: glycosyltransferase family 9 protein [Candidatus Omnitrophota bacterium]